MDVREKALNAALEILRGTGRYGVKEILDTAREIEAYLNGTDIKPAQTGGPTGAIIGGTQFSNYGMGQNQKMQGMPQ